MKYNVKFYFITRPNLQSPLNKKREAFLITSCGGCLYSNSRLRYIVNDTNADCFAFNNLVNYQPVHRTHNETMETNYDV